MSVMFFDEKAIYELTGGLIGNEHTLTGLNFSPEYAIWERQRLEIKPKKSVLDIKKEFIERVLWFAWVGNKVAYALQYIKNPDFFDYDDSENAKIKPINMDTKELRERIRSLHYNLYTNGGTKFIDEKWFKPFKLIMDRLDSLYKMESDDQ